MVRVCVVIRVLASAGVLVGACAGALAQPLPPASPDLQVPGSSLSGWTIQSIAGGGRELRFPVVFMNGGVNPLDVRGGTVYGDGTQDVLERRYDMFGGFVDDRVVGRFTFQSAQMNMPIDGWAAYRVRVRPADQSVGAIVAQSEYRSACLRDDSHVNPSAPGSPFGQVFTGCGRMQGISIGWATVVGAAASGQAIDVTCVPNGDYWLEAEVDPHNLFTESNETNNIGRLAITVSGQPSGGFYFALQPASATVNAGAAVVMAATFSGTPASMRWKKNGVDVFDGGGYSGATTPMLSISGANAVHAGTYILVATGVCGSRSSEAGVLTVRACAADFNQSGGLSLQDIFDFLMAWFGGLSSADFNHVGGLSAQDIFDFLGAWFAGCG